jgi:hypothetical protein
MFLRNAGIYLQIRMALVHSNISEFEISLEKWTVVFWIVTALSLVGGDQRFGGTYHHITYTFRDDL